MCVSGFVCVVERRGGGGVVVVVVVVVYSGGGGVREKCPPPQKSAINLTSAAPPKHIAINTHAERARLRSMMTLTNQPTNQPAQPILCFQRLHRTRADGKGEGAGASARWWRARGAVGPIGITGHGSPAWRSPAICSSAACEGALCSHLCCSARPHPSPSPPAYAHHAPSGNVAPSLEKSPLPRPPSASTPS